MIKNKLVHCAVAAFTVLCVNAYGADLRFKLGPSTKQVTRAQAEVLINSPESKKDQIRMIYRSVILTETCARDALEYLKEGKEASVEETLRECRKNTVKIDDTDTAVCLSNEQFKNVREGDELFCAAISVKYELDRKVRLALYNLSGTQVAFLEGGREEHSGKKEKNPESARTYLEEIVGRKYQSKSVGKTDEQSNAAELFFHNLNEWLLTQPEINDKKKSE